MHRAFRHAVRSLAFISVALLSSGTGHAAETRLYFDNPQPATIQDVYGQGTGFTYRLPDTGSAIPANDPQMDLAAIPGCLAMTSTRSDIASGANTPQMEALGTLATNVRGQDLTITALLRDIELQTTGQSDQLMLYAGQSVQKNVRAGFHVDYDDYPHTSASQYGLYMKNGVDAYNLWKQTPAAWSNGDDVRLTLSRTQGQWAMFWDNLSNDTRGNSSLMALPWLENEEDLHIGIHYANPRNDNPKTSLVDCFLASHGPHTVTFDAPVPGTLTDKAGIEIGFTHRLPGTGSALPLNSPLLDMSTNPGRLTVTSVYGDLSTKSNVDQMDTPGRLLTDVTGEDISISALFCDIDLVGGSDQLGIYVGADVNNTLRVSLHRAYPEREPQYAMSHVRDGQSHTDYVTPLGSPAAWDNGDDILMTLAREEGCWELSWCNLTNGDRGASGSLSYSWLDECEDLYAGVFYSTPYNSNVRTSQIDFFSATAVPEPSAVMLLGMGSCALLAFRRRRQGSTA